ncbi:ATP synthase protein I [Ectopseudomonas oleovorans]|uniref:ATP synthase protein I n=2 Tax=Pseudomonadaceae TaxID=135621 RepID=A0A397NG77_ECTOL|nr:MULTISPECIES: F0F1 ATP synthase subunit I [Pseudomonas]QMV63460.1 F0F1 ATP synthase subunit I [Pseudomonas berkeleyensis]RIA35298.1 ATP synthase protein I [Pseudomonas oleovorans]WSO38923.1 F0F1 ATP synthase subunit I [Pseudomonas berkeleyensis]
MERRMPKRLPFHRLPVFPVLVAQLIVLLLAAAVGWQWRGNVAGYSALIGGLIAWLPNLYFAHKAFRFSGARAAREIVRSFYAGEAGKLILTFVLFALAFAGVKPMEAPMLFGAYLLTLMVSWFSPLLITKFSRP